MSDTQSIKSLETELEIYHSLLQTRDDKIQEQNTLIAELRHQLKVQEKEISAKWRKKRWFRIFGKCLHEYKLIKEREVRGMYTWSPITLVKVYECQDCKKIKKISIKLN